MFKKLVEKLKEVYPLYFAVFPVLSFYSGNIKELIINVIFRPILLISALTFIILVLAKIILKDDRRAKIFILIFILYFFSFGYFTQSFKNLNQIFILGVYTLTAIFSAAILFKIKDSPRIPTFFTIVGIYLVASSAIKIIPYELERYDRRLKIKVDGSLNLKPTKKVETPDIYYIIFDRYANSEILKQQYNFDNSSFVNFLRSNGFYVAEESFANYPRTHLSLASSLNMDYLESLAKAAGSENSDYNPAFDMVSDNLVAKFLKSSGYKYYYFGDWWTPTQVSHFADVNINLYAGSNEFLQKFAKTTILSPIVGSYWKGSRLFGLFQDRIYENTNYKFKNLGEVAPVPGPKFIFAHMLFPHYPYIFDKNCNKVSEKRPGSHEKKYLEQLTCANTKIRNMVEEILKKSNKPPIIILQSDEGPFKTDEMNVSGENTNWKKVSGRAITRHMKILNAYYLPGFDTSKLYKSISPVNTFRLIFNFYFGQNLDLLPDKSYFIPDINHPYKYIDITDRVSVK